ncbi:MAG TPA: hypothetical protein VHE61_12675 [Opitutaceae bacterium]|nr:hypothetical protein [Opitutaceae bacterium]
MSASPLSFLRAGPPPPKVVLLPDGLFFSRAVPITAGATAAEVASQVELALESSSPFPLAQLYYGWYWTPGAEQAFVFASYRRRFTTEQTAAWADAELVIPASAALFGGAVEPATTLLLNSPEGLTAIHWESPAVPSRVVFRPIDPEASDEQRVQLREELIRGLGGSRTVIDLLVPPAADSGQPDREIVLRSGDFVSRLPVTTAAALDVRDKAELAARRSARQRDIVLWRVVLGCAAALCLFLLGEFALLGGNAWHKVRLTQLNARAPTVDKIKQSQELATGIDDLLTKRLLPIEMVTAILGTNGERKPADVVVTRIQSGGTLGLYTVVLELQTTNAAQVPVYRAALQKLPECDSVNLDVLPSQGVQSKYRLTVTFKPGALKPQPA